MASYGCVRSLIQPDQPNWKTKTHVYFWPLGSARLVKLNYLRHGGCLHVHLCWPLESRYLEKDAKGDTRTVKVSFMLNLLGEQIFRSHCRERAGHDAAEVS